MDELFNTPANELKRSRTLLCLPTTCGTGSEVTVTAVFDRTRKGTKVWITSYAIGYQDCAQATIASRMFAEQTITMILPIYRKNFRGGVRMDLKKDA